MEIAITKKAHEQQQQMTDAWLYYKLTYEPSAQGAKK